MAAKGYGAREPGEALTRARGLCEQLDRVAQPGPIMYGQWVFHGVRGSRRGRARPGQPRALLLAKHRRDSGRARRALGEVRRQTVAVLFVDIVGFARMAERMPPEAVVTMLRQFHERMTVQIFACGGTVENISAMRCLPCSACRTRVRRMPPTRSAARTG
jgi:hypothetical protein